MDGAEERSPFFSIKEANLIFVILAVVFLTLGAYVQSVSLLPGLLFTEYGILLLPILLYAAIRKKDIRRTFRLKGIPLNVAAKIVALGFLLLPTVAMANLFAVWLIDKIGLPVIDGSLPTPGNPIEFLIHFFVIAVTAGICEEMFFRGMVMSAYEQTVSPKQAALLAAFMFGIFHFNPQNFFGPILLGAMFAYLVQLTDSIVAGMLAHAVNNGIAVTMNYLLTLFQQGISSEVLEASGQPELIFESQGTLIAVVLFYTAVAVIGILGIRIILRSIRQDYPKYEPGQTFFVNDKAYTVLSEESDHLFIQPEQPLATESDVVMTTTKEKLKRAGAQNFYRIWGEQSKPIPVADVIPIAVTLIFYGFVVYYAYIRMV